MRMAMYFYCWTLFVLGFMLRTIHFSLRGFEKFSIKAQRHDEQVLHHSNLNPGCKTNPLDCDDLCQRVGDFVLRKREEVLNGVYDWKRWAWYYPSVSSYLSCAKTKIFVEVGSAFGSHAAYHLNHSEFLEEYHIVDPFLAGYDPDDPMSQLLGTAAANATPSEISTAWATSMLHHFRFEGRYTTKDTIKPAGCKVELHHMVSEKAAVFFEDRSIDTVFIDGLHTYEGVIKDIEAWAPKIKLEGSLIFNDFGDWPGVTEAVRQYSDKERLEIDMLDNTNAILQGRKECIEEVSARRVSRAFTRYRRKFRAAKKKKRELR
jgi:Methyltransferase domain